MHHTRQRVGRTLSLLAARAASPGNKKFPSIKVFGFSHHLLLDGAMHDVDVRTVCRR